MKSHSEAINRQREGDRIARENAKMAARIAGPARPRGDEGPTVEHCADIHAPESETLRRWAQESMPRFATACSGCSGWHNLLGQLGEAAAVDGARYGRRDQG